MYPRPRFRWRGYGRHCEVCRSDEVVSNQHLKTIGTGLEDTKVVEVRVRIIDDPVSILVSIPVSIPSTDIWVAGRGSAIRADDKGNGNDVSMPSRFSPIKNMLVGVRKGYPHLGEMRRVTWENVNLRVGKRRRRWWWWRLVDADMKCSQELVGEETTVAETHLSRLQEHGIGAVVLLHPGISRRP